MKNNIIFLDVDGVLNSHLYIENYKGSREEWIKLSERERNLDPKAVKMLDQLCKDTNSKIVLSSTWRLGDEGKLLKEFLSELNFKSEIIDCTGRCCSGIRGVEIYNWWKDNKDKYNEYAIIDDDNDMMLYQQYNFFKIDGYVGLTPTICWKIERLLNGRREESMVL